MGVITRTIRIVALYSTMLFLVAGYPLSVMATEPADVVQTESSVAPATTTATDSPPVTSSEPVAPPEPTYTYNSTTGRWDSNLWQYNPTTGVYEKPQPPVIIEPIEADSTSSLSAPVSTPEVVDETGQATTAVNATTVSNALDSLAQSGDALVTRNTLAGDAGSGDASATATILNNVNSTMSSGDNQKAATFVSDVMGDVNGDIMLYPALLKAMLESSNQDSSSTNTAALSNTTKINNDITLQANSGNASVTDNTQAGSATTGSANTVANVINIINSMVSAHQSFIGTINIYGNLSGDILIAPDFIPQLLASNGGPSQLTQASPTTTVSVDDTQTIVNNIALAAESGSAAVLGNTRAGSATTGDANTNIVIFNLSGHQIVASNSLLVFVNVLGTWVGVIVDAPVGATSAAIGNEVTNSVVNAPDLTLKSQTNSQIVNTINLSSKSGDATVAGNTAAGSATTGQATASANVANIAGSQLSMSGWFGVLFINVFGSWYGSFGIDTSYGNQPQNNSTGTHTNPDKVVPAEKTMRVIEFIPHAASAATVISSNNEGTPPQVTQLQPGSVLSATTNGTPAVVGISGEYSDFRLPIVIGAMGLIGLSALGMKRLLFHGGQPPIA